jgi:ribosome-associated translation inhibitor RaiA
MNIDICGLSFALTPAITRHVERRIQTALAPVAAASTVRGVMARLRDINGPRGGVDKGCRLVAWLDGRKPVIADAIDRDLYIAVELAAGKLKENAWRLLRRGRALRREDRSRLLKRLAG